MSCFSPSFSPGFGFGFSFGFYLSLGLLFLNNSSGFCCCKTLISSTKDSISSTVGYLITILHRPHPGLSYLLLSLSSTHSLWQQVKLSLPSLIQSSGLRLNTVTKANPRHHLQSPAAFLYVLPLWYLDARLRILFCYKKHQTSYLRSLLYLAPPQHQLLY